MDQPISTMMEKHVKVVDMEATISEVAAVLYSTKLSCVPVADSSGRDFGIICAPDIVHFDVEKRNPNAVRAWEVCTYRVIEVSPEIHTREVARLMIEHKVHHVVVVSDNRTIYGIVSALDFVKRFLEETPA
ncbi:MAG: CBS domain-containing protein [Burkholderiales bacterium]